MTIEEYERKKLEILCIKSSGIVKDTHDCISNEKCKECKGSGCCNHYPCAFAPEEFLSLNNVDYVKKLLMTGIIIIYQLNKNLSYIRARGKFDPPILVTNLTLSHNPCSLLTDNGCVLDSLFRPTEGLLLLPQYDCDEYYGPREITSDWSEYRKTMKRIVRKCNNIPTQNVHVTSEDVE